MDPQVVGLLPPRRPVAFVEESAFNAIRVPLQRERTVLQVRQEHGRDFDVVINDLPFGKTGLGIENFLQARDGDFDLVLAMYHDQANMAAKLLGFGEVVTLIAGIPFIRVSVGHGTAFDIAGRGIAKEKNFGLAIEKAIELARLKMGQVSR